MREIYTCLSSQHRTLGHCCCQGRLLGTWPHCAHLALGTTIPQELERDGMREAAGP